MKQTILKSLMSLAVLLTGLQAFAHEFEVTNSDGVTIYYNITSATDLTVKVTYKGSYSDSYDEYSGHVTIPEKVTYSGIAYSVTSIDMFAFSYCSSLTSVTIPKSVTSIGDGAFIECSGLTSVMIPNSVTSIGNYVFYGCRGLTSIVVESGNTVYDSRNNCNAIIETATNTLIQGRLTKKSIRL